MPGKSIEASVWIKEGIGWIKRTTLPIDHDQSYFSLWQNKYGDLDDFPWKQLDFDPVAEVGDYITFHPWSESLYIVQHILVKYIIAIDAAGSVEKINWNYVHKVSKLKGILLWGKSNR